VRLVKEAFVGQGEYTSEEARSMVREKLPWSPIIFDV